MLYGTLAASADGADEEPKEVRGQWGVAFGYDLNLSGTSAGVFATVGYRFSEKFTWALRSVIPDPKNPDSIKDK